MKARREAPPCLFCVKNQFTAQAIMPLGNSRFQRRIAVPKGWLNPARRSHYFSRPCGTRWVIARDPALKRRAIVGCPSGTKSLEFRKGICPSQAVFLTPALDQPV